MNSKSRPNRAFQNKVSPIMTVKQPSQRNWIVDLLVILFGISSWVAVNGLWVELPILVNSLPESWKLASYIIITSQIANLGPLIFSAARKIWSQKILEVPVIHFSLAIVITACALLCFFWEDTSYIFGELHSTSLLVLTFFLSAVDCTSSLLYLPFIANFKEQYVVSYLAGSGLSGPLPGLLALGQGVGGYAQCRNTSVTTVTDHGNVTRNGTEAYYPPPRFSANIFFGILCVQMVISWVAFVLLNNLSICKRERVSLMPLSLPCNPAVADKFQSSVEKDLSTSIEKTTSSEQHLLSKSLLSNFHYIVLLIVQGFISTLHNGVLLSIQTYSCLPYGSLAFHLTVTLSSIANPICCFVAMFFPLAKVWPVTGIAGFGTCWGAYILMTALMSPTPPFVDLAIGAYLVVLAWIMVSGSVAYTKACIASMLRRAGGQTALYRCGVVTQIGSAVGALVTFCLVEYTTLFKSFDPCS